MFVYKVVAKENNEWKVVDVYSDVEDARDSVRCIRKYERKAASYVREYVKAAVRVAA